MSQRFAEALHEYACIRRATSSKGTLSFGDEFVDQGRTASGFSAARLMKIEPGVRQAQLPERSNFELIAAALTRLPAWSRDQDCRQQNLAHDFLLSKAFSSFKLDGAFCSEITSQLHDA
jgi:hypothetical protein